MESTFNYTELHAEPTTTSHGFIDTNPGSCSKKNLNKSIIVSWELKLWQSGSHMHFFTQRVPLHGYHDETWKSIAESLRGGK